MAFYLAKALHSIFSAIAVPPEPMSKAAKFRARKAAHTIKIVLKGFKSFTNLVLVQILSLVTDHSHTTTSYSNNFNFSFPSNE